MAQVQSVDTPVRVPLATPLETQLRTNSAGEVLLKAHLNNCFAEYQPDTQTFSVEKRPGLSLFSDLGLSNDLGRGRGIGFLFGFIIAIASTGVTSSLYCIDANTGVATFQELVDNSGGYYRFHLLPNAGGLIFGNGVALYLMTAPGAPLVQIVTNFPANFVKSIVYLNSRFYVGALPAIIRGALNLNDPTVWDLLNQLSVQDEPDYLVGTFKHLSYLVALKDWTTEFFFNDGQNLIGSTLSPQQQSKLDIGCFNVNTVQEIDGSLFWLSGNRQKKAQVARLEGLQYNIISTPHVEKLLEAMVTEESFVNSSSTQVFAFYMKVCGHRFYVLGLTDLGFSLVYDIDQQLWYVWTEPVTADRAQGLWGISSVISGPTGITYCQDYYNGNIYLFGPCYKYPTDAGREIEVNIYGKTLDLSTPRAKQVGMMFFDAERVSGNKLQIRFNDDDYLPGKWTEFREVDLDVSRPQLPNCGTFYRRAHHVRHNLPVPFRINNLSAQIDIGKL